MFTLLARAMYRWRRVVLILAAGFLVFAGVWGIGGFGALASGGFEDPESESFRANAALESALGRSGADVVVVYAHDTETVDSPAFERSVVDTLAVLP